MEYSYQAAFDMFTWNQGNNQESFRPVALRARDYFFPNQTGVSTDSSTTDGGDSFLVSRSVGMSSKPTTIAIVTQPPKTIAVGDVFVVTIKATLSTGAAAPYVPITANVTSGGAYLFSPRQTSWTRILDLSSPKVRPTETGPSWTTTARR